LDAALGIDDVPGKLERMTYGNGEPADYFSMFRPCGAAEKAAPVCNRWLTAAIMTGS
jgi:hypothetical protein